MDKYDFTNNILEDLAVRLKGKKSLSKRIKLYTIESLATYKEEEKNDDIKFQVAKSNKKLVLTEGDILKIKEKEMVIPQDAIITPLARDAARRLGITIRKINGVT